MSGRIVIVEDEKEILELLRDVLELDGFAVVGVARPELAYDAAQSVHPDVFLIDLMLPGMSGVELAEELRQRGYRDTPMIAMSASRLMAKVAAQSGLFQDVLDKPFDLAVLVTCVDQYLISLERSPHDFSG